MDEQQYLKETADFFDGAFSYIDEDAPDGAFMQQHVDTAEALFNTVYIDLGFKKPKNLDGHDVMMHYFENKSIK